uniref:Speckle-type POZ protein-like (inferred by orthology to a human protein) n=1 Tax=Strongyloides papillosus TaxID=174720 RepID=A0A0N5BZA1_STREA
MDKRHEGKSDVPIDHLCNVKGKFKKFNYECSIENFSQRLEKTGERIESPTCVVGSNDEISVWCLYIYPHGSTESSKDFVSVYLTLVEPDRAKVKYYKLSILDDKEEEKHICMNKVVEFNNRGWGFTKFIKRDVLLNESNGLLVNDKLTILCEAEIIGVNCENNNNSETSVNCSKPQSNLSLDLGNLFNSQMFTDCCIKVGETTIKVHKGILATRSPGFHNI